MSETVSGKSVSSRVKRSDVRSALWWARVPASVALDPAISSDAVRVYTLISLDVYEGRVARVGMRQMGKILDVSAATIMRRVKELLAAGHIRMRTEAGRRAFYEVTSPVFGQKQGRETVVVSSPRGGRRFASIDREEVA